MDESPTNYLGILHKIGLIGGRVVCGEDLREIVRTPSREQSVTVSYRRPGFSELFDRAATACAESQRLVGLSTQTMTSTRMWRADTASHRRRTAAQMRETWAEAEAVHSVLRDEVERIARTMRESGLDDRAAVATVRAHIRFVLYDGGLAEQDAEPVVARASLWVEQIYAAA